MDLIYSPWIWFFVVCLILFVVFIIVVELHGDQTDMHNWVWILLVFIILFFAISICLYLYYYKTTIVTDTIVQPITMIQQPFTNLINSCYNPCNTPIHTPCNSQCNTPIIHTPCVEPITQPCHESCDIFKQPKIPMHYLNPRG